MDSTDQTVYLTLKTISENKSVWSMAFELGGNSSYTIGSVFVVLAPRNNSKYNKKIPFFYTDSGIVVKFILVLA